MITTRRWQLAAKLAAAKDKPAAALKEAPPLTAAARVSEYAVEPQ